MYQILLQKIIQKLIEYTRVDSKSEIRNKNENL